MPIKLSPSVASLDELPESIRDAYEERDGRFYFTRDIEVEDLPSVAGLRSALDKEKRAARERGERLRLFDGFDPDTFDGLSGAEVKELIAKRNTPKSGQDEEDTAALRQQFDRTRQQLVENHTKELAKREQATKSAESFIEKLLKTNASSMAITELKGNVRALMPHVSSATRVVRDEGGEFSVEVIDERGNVRHSKKTGEPMTVAEFVSEMREQDDFKALFAGTGVGGAGSKGANDRNAGGGAAKRWKVTPAEARNPRNASIVAAREEAKKLGVPFTDLLIIE